MINRARCLSDSPGLVLAGQADCAGNSNSLHMQQTAYLRMNNPRSASKTAAEVGSAAFRLDMNEAQHCAMAAAGWRLYQKGEGVSRCRGPAGVINVP